MGERKLNQIDSELEYWKSFYPDVFRDKTTGEIVSLSLRRGDIVSQMVEKPTPKQPIIIGRMYEPVGEEQKGLTKFFKKRKKQFGAKSDVARYRQANYNFEVPGAQLKLHPLREGRRKGWDIKTLNEGKNITYNWNCGCKCYIDFNGDENWSFCGGSNCDIE